MEIDRQTVDYVAKLARLYLDDKAMEDLREDLSQIVGYVTKLQELNTEDVEQTAHVLPLNNVFREDIVRQSMDRDRVLSNTDYKKDGFFEVPKVFD
ncbi:Asp-tRNA(Asn)/Glu-tRNA(Gln) amidotransferase subunit GatC [Calorimonas adulescens]|jgi:glutamyl-tRNA(Gln) and/or aspartyl-tRNA(Asn) amidotransferase, C subunit|uniref:Aspartyl/glutamyl-tRNA(Asn/Gln) amidotransferase subunit C n=1 Tax=Calorimonas adulescens TaxID=2606906 RepID=A0A5D8QAS4_9THEO|nr:Asp-tRNA(Asn)/Glu-tRNA(Gln) amidotransferase subunit GatC [Calorimonas adulescens]TZE81700.1 Asp-tRNA(Asn)/Glu-tRNA(Gln) amidotransferase subunit GatC [Calorimonas adulescens]